MQYVSTHAEKLIGLEQVNQPTIPVKLIKN